MGTTIKNTIRCLELQRGQVIGNSKRETNIISKILGEEHKKFFK